MTQPIIEHIAPFNKIDSKPPGQQLTIIETTINKLQTKFNDIKDYSLNLIANANMEAYQDLSEVMDTITAEQQAALTILYLKQDIINTPNLDVKSYFEQQFNIFN